MTVGIFERIKLKSDEDLCAYQANIHTELEFAITMRYNTIAEYNRELLQYIELEFSNREQERIRQRWGL